MQNRKPNKLNLHSTFSEQDLRLVMSDSEFCQFIEEWYSRKIEMKLEQQQEQPEFIKRKKLVKQVGYSRPTGEFKHKQE